MQSLQSGDLNGLRYDFWSSLLGLLGGHDPASTSTIKQYLFHTELSYTICNGGKVHLIECATHQERRKLDTLDHFITRFGEPSCRE